MSDFELYNTRSEEQNISKDIIQLSRYEVNSNLHIKKHSIPGEKNTTISKKIYYDCY